jgi:membrane protease YdiL (CAAX protease family)
MASDASPPPVPPPAFGLPAAAAVSAAEVLRPALLLWLSTEIAAGVVAQFWAFCWRDDDTGISAFFVWLYELGYIGFGVLVLWFIWPDREARCVFRKPRPRMIELCIVVGVAASLLLAMWERQVPRAWSHVSPIEMEFALGWSAWACLVASAVAPAVFEELMYRGLLLQRFARVLPIELAVAAQAMLFSLMHRDAVFLLPHFVFGVVAGLMRVAAGALWPCMLTHFLWNAYIVAWQFGWL